MKHALSIALATLSLHSFAQNIVSVPFYFSVTEDAHLPLKDTAWNKIPIKGVASDKAYLRGYHYPDNTVAGRRLAMRELLAKQVIQTGDVVLSFRPEWEKTIPYAHIQMGVSHAGIAYVDNGVVKNLDMPLDAEYNGASISSGFDSKHYLETPQIQILRPRNFGAAKKNNLKAWIAELRKNYVSIRGKGLLKFNSDYSAPKIDRYSKDDAFVTTMARILLGKDSTSTKLTMFCSEYAWSLLSLSNCAPSDPELLDGSVQDASCVDPIFNAMTVVDNGSSPGLTEGPLAVLEALDVSASEKMGLMNDLFTQGAMNGLSSGHRALATNPQVGALIEALKMLYPAKLTGNSAAVAQISAQVNPPGGRNYSPTSFLINSMLEQTDPERKFDYVATIMFGK